MTSWLDSRKRDSIYERSRSLEHYRREFPDCQFSDARPFRDKFIFTIRPAAALDGRA